eukprot:6590563-Pyramimonas_sp.AAC.1
MWYHGVDHRHQENQANDRCRVVPIVTRLCVDARRHEALLPQQRGSAAFAAKYLDEVPVPRKLATQLASRCDDDSEHIVDEVAVLGPDERVPHESCHARAVPRQADIRLRRLWNCSDAYRQGGQN